MFFGVHGYPLKYALNQVGRISTLQILLSLVVERWHVKMFVKELGNQFFFSIILFNQSLELYVKNVLHYLLSQPSETRPSLPPSRPSRPSRLPFNKGIKVYCSVIENVSVSSHVNSYFKWFSLSQINDHQLVVLQILVTLFSSLLWFCMKIQSFIFSLTIMYVCILKS